MPMNSLSTQIQNSIRCSWEQMCSQSSANSTDSSCIPLSTFLSAGASIAAAVGSAIQKSVSLSIGNALHLPDAQSQLLIDDYMQNPSVASLSSSPSSSNATPTHSPSQSEIVSITGALIVCTVLISCVLLTHLFDALDDLMRRCKPILVNPGQCVRQLHSSLSSPIQAQDRDSSSSSSDANKLASLGAPWTAARVVAWLTGRLRKRVN